MQYLLAGSFLCPSRSYSLLLKSAAFQKIAFLALSDQPMLGTNELHPFAAYKWELGFWVLPITPSLQLRACHPPALLTFSPRSWSSVGKDVRWPRDFVYLPLPADQRPCGSQTVIVVKCT